MTSPSQPPSTADLIAWDRQFLWHPFTPMKPWCEDKDILVIERGEAEFLIDTEGRRYIDGVSSLWCNVHGHRVPELDQALRDQLDKIAHSTLLGLANVPSILLAKKLVELAHASHLALDKVFLSDDGSTAVEVACKMAWQFWQNRGAPRPKFLTLNDAYHGDTLGAVSLGGIPTFHRPFHGLTFPTDYLSFPRAGHEADLPKWSATLDHRLTMMENVYAAIVVEPLIQGAGGMIVHAHGALRELRRLTDKHNMLLIADEVMTGFGRTGKMFACEVESITPDLLCLSKNLTGGYMPLGATLTTQKIFDAFYADPREGKTFFHGHTFTGHPLACATALASIDLMQKNNLVARTAHLGTIMADTLNPLRNRPFIRDIRTLGLIAAIEIGDEDGQPFPSHFRVGGEICRRMRLLGVLLRPLADTLVLMPPLAIAEENLRRLLDAVVNSLFWIPDILAEKRSATKGVLVNGGLPSPLPTYPEFHPEHPRARLHPFRGPGLFITGTGTGVGKTTVTAAIAGALRRLRVRVGICKAVASGCPKHPDRGNHANEPLVDDDFLSPDAEIAALAAGLDPREDSILPYLSPVRFGAPVAPRLAAEVEGRPTDWSRVATALDFWQENCDVLLVEGAGGWYVPLDQHDFMIADLAAALRLPVVVVTTAEAGTLNNTLLTVHAIRDRSLAVAGMVINCVAAEQDRDLNVASNLHELPRLTGVPVRGILPKIKIDMGKHVSEVLVDRMMPFAREWWAMVRKDG